jgi:predicted nucleic acid-binding protein
MKALFDSNIIIDALERHPKARAEIAAYADVAISIITYVEVMAGTFPHNEEAARALLLRFKVVECCAKSAGCAYRMPLSWPPHKSKAGC